MFMITNERIIIHSMSDYYTGRGDGGMSFVGLKKINKTDLVMDALGDLDELNSLLGYIKSTLKGANKKRFFNIIADIQENIFIVQAQVASHMFEKQYVPPHFAKEKGSDAERMIAQFEKLFVPTKKFIVPGTNELSARFDHARAIARRAERSVLRFSKKQKLDPDISAYLNRLSSLLFVMARVVAHKKGVSEKAPRYR